MKAKAKKIALVCLLAFGAALAFHSLMPGPQQAPAPTAQPIAILP